MAEKVCAVLQKTLKDELDCKYEAVPVKVIPKKSDEEDVYFIVVRIFTNEVLWSSISMIERVSKHFNLTPFTLGFKIDGGILRMEVGIS
jgi:hypothetical protein